MDDSDVSKEFGGADLGDERLSRRLERIGMALSEHPEASFPAAMRSEGQLEAFYRFINNSSVSFDGIRAPHVKQTVERCRGQKEVLVLHDTTSLKFGGKREGLGRLETSASRFFLHASLAIKLDREPLGVLVAENLVQKGPKRKKSSKRGIRKDPQRESLRWGRAVEECEDTLGVPGHAIHVMDREGDNYELFSQLVAPGTRFIIRAAHDRCVVGETERLKAVSLRGRCRFRRTVRISRHDPFLKFDQDIHPERDAREVTLAVSAVSAQLKRSNNFTPSTPQTLRVNVVTAVEQDPLKGRKPVCWHLITSEPIATNAQLRKVIDAYCARWVVEELFKALKTGCQFERRQLGSCHSIANALALFLPIATKLLALRSAARTEPDAPCAQFTDTQIHLLRINTTRKLSATPTNDEAFLALAELGGHLRSNGPPGWLILGRALERLLVLEQGLLAGGFS